MLRPLAAAARAAFTVVAGAALIVPAAGIANAQPGSLPIVAAQGYLDFDARIGECVNLGGTEENATIERAACGSPASNYVVIDKVSNSDECIADIDGWYAETLDDVQTGALCLDYDWVIGGCMDMGADSPYRIACTEPAVEGVRVTAIVHSTSDLGACASGVGYQYTERNKVVCVEEF
ncbi:LppU family putative lipoprotein [Nocardia higoensis]|uniref:LppU family putative lipoprotein n=1 Tax=Nocardia higoensis TaxID=228599 RepID=UPI0003065CE3|nr:hypothetical protein [Nocardia higoensis]